MRHSILAITVGLLCFTAEAIGVDSTKNAKPLEIKDTITTHDSDQVVVNIPMDSISESILGDTASLKLETANEVIVVPEIFYSDELALFPYNTVDVDQETYMYQVEALGFEVPLEFNNLVKQQIDFFATRWQPTLKRMITLSEHYFPIYEEIFIENGTPTEIKYLSIVESALNPKARSRAGAVGPWQFMPVTGRIYHLQSDYYMDERRSVEKSTKAASDYLNAMYLQFGDWYLAIASYNCGPGNVRKAIRRSGKRDFWGIYPYLPRETQNYVPKYIAMAYLMNYYADYGITPSFEEDLKLPYISMRCHSQMEFSVIADHVEMTSEELLRYNPELKKEVIPYKLGEYYLNIPEDRAYLFEVYESEIIAISETVLAEKAAIAAKSKEVITYHVKKGECLPIIARRYGCTVAQLKQWNGLTGSIIHPNQRLRIERN